MPYRCWVSTTIGRLRARFVPIQKWDTGFGTVFLGNIYLTNGGNRRIGDKVTIGRYFADELEHWDGMT
jgi:hypothetical protein